MTVQTFDAVIVGGGFAGMYMLHRLRRAGLSAKVFEAGEDVGGTWYWNRYPGARCDVPSVDYSYAFSDEIQQEWTWTERFAAQPEILAYARFVAEKLDLRRDMDFGVRVTAAEWREDRRDWLVATDRGERVAARWVVMATGCLSVPKAPELAGLEDFAGEVFYTSIWPHEGVDFAGNRVGVFGTGSSGIQAIPVIAESAERLTVFQRSPNYTLPARNRPVDAAEAARIKAEYPAIRARARQAPSGGTRPITDRRTFSVSDAERREIYERSWAEGGITFGGAFGDVLVDDAANEAAADFVRAKIDEIVADPEVAEALKPRDLAIGARRICMDTDYYATFNRPDVSLVDLKREPFERATAQGVRAGGRLHELDALVLATGFDAMTGALLSIDIRGVGGRPLRDAWADGPVSYLGLMVAGFPNLFTITGPGSPSVLSNMIASIEQHVEWIDACLAWMIETGAERIEADPRAQADWVAHVAEVAEPTVLARAASWYTGANVPGKPRVFMPYVAGLVAYRAACDRVVAQGYAGFHVETRRQALRA